MSCANAGVAEYSEGVREQPALVVMLLNQTTDSLRIRSGGRDPFVDAVASGFQPRSGTPRVCWEFILSLI